MSNERRAPDRPREQDLNVEVAPNAAGGVIVKVVHLPSRRFATHTHRDREIAERGAKRELARILARASWRKQRGMTG